MIIQGRDLSQLVNDFVWYMRNLLIAKTTDEPGDMLDMSEENLAVLKEEAAGVVTETLMQLHPYFLGTFRAAALRVTEADSGGDCLYQADDAVDGTES